MRTAVDASPEKPILIDKFLERAAEIDVDALADETACRDRRDSGAYRGSRNSLRRFVKRSAAQKIAAEHLETIRHYTQLWRTRLKVSGLMNIQFAIKDDRVYVLEVNPRASRTVPFVAKATGVPIAKIASLVMAGEKTLAEFDLPDVLSVPKIFVKSPVFPFKKFAGVDPILGPEMHSTGEVMGVGATFGEAYGKAMEGAGLKLPLNGKAFISVNDADKGQAVVLARRLNKLGFRPHRDLRHRQPPARSRARMRERFQGQRRPSEHRRPHQPGRNSFNHQHSARPHLALRRKSHPQSRPPIQRALRHDDHRCRGFG